MVVLLLAACGPGGQTGADGSTSGNAGAGATSAAVDSIVIVMGIDPLRVGTVTVTAQVSAGGEPLAGARVAVRGDMTHAGMTPALGQLTEGHQGTYATDEFELEMAGDWIITIEVEAADGRKATSETFVSVTAR